MVKKGRGERFDDVFQLVIIIETLLLGFLWNLENQGRVYYAFLFYVLTLILWAYGHLKDGNFEYSIKVASFQASLLFLFMLVFILLIPQPTIEISVIFIMIMPIISLLLSLPLISYLRKLSDRKNSLLSLVAITLGEFLGYFVVFCFLYILHLVNS